MTHLLIKMRGLSFKHSTFVLFIASLIWFSNSQNEQPRGSVYNVLHYGAKGDGKTDDTKAFEAAWAVACKVAKSTMVMPSGYTFLVGPTSFSGSNCQSNINFQLDGTILAPTNPNAWASSGLDQWLEFTQLTGFTIQGKGKFDGSGSIWWTNKQVAKTKPMALRFFSSSKVTVTGITIKNSPQFHLTFENCDGVLVHHFTIASPGNSPNTDGIHLHNTKNVIIHNSNLSCGDDCISIQTGCKNVLVHNVNCGPGHGISIGSLGIDVTTACVSNITVRDTNIRGTMTGVRIKTWQGGAGLVQGVVFSNIQVSEVQFPIIIDQYYCDHSTCKNDTTAVSIADIAFENIKGTYTVQPIHLSCSDSKPCVDLRLTDIELKPKQENYKMRNSFCWKAFGKMNAPIIPQVDCLQEGRPLNSLGYNDDKCEA